jgi:ElaB protein
MAEATKSAQEAFRTTGKTTDKTVGSSAQSQDAGEGSSTIGRSAEQPSRRGRVSGVAATREAREDSSSGLNKTWEQAMNYSRENPGKSTLIAFGVGIGLGLLMSNGFTTRSRSQRIVPPLMNAISEITSALFR